MKQKPQPQKHGHTHIELSMNSGEEGGGFGLIVESGSLRESEKLFNRIYKKVSVSQKARTEGAEGLYQWSKESD